MNQAADESQSSVDFKMGELEKIAFSPTGNEFLTVSGDEKIRVWDVAKGQVSHIFPAQTKEINTAVISPDGSKILTGNKDRSAKLLDIRSGKLLRTFSGHAYPVLEVAFSPDGTQILTSSNDLRAWGLASEGWLWDVESGNQLKSIGWWNLGVDGLTIVSFFPDGRKFLTGSMSGFGIWDVETGKREHLLVPKVIEKFDLVEPGKHERPRKDRKPDGIYLTEDISLLMGIDLVTLSPDGKKIMAGHSGNGSDYGLVKIWNTEVDCVNTSAPLRIFGGDSENPEEKFNIQTAAFSPDGQRILAGCEDGEVREWDIGSGKLLRSYSGHTRQVTHLMYLPGGLHFLSGSATSKHASRSGDQTIRLWDTRSGQALKVFRGHSCGDQ